MSTGKGHLTYWCFSLDQLERALAAYTERRMNEGATVAHAKQATRMSTGKYVEGHLTYWCFSLDQLERALAAYTERRMNEGATVAHAKQEAWAIAQFLLSPEARAAKMIAGGDEANRG